MLCFHDCVCMCVYVCVLDPSPSFLARQYRPSPSKVRQVNESNKLYYTRKKFVEARFKKLFREASSSGF